MYYCKFKYKQFSKFEEITKWLGSKTIDILSIQETKIDKTFPNSQFNVEGFKLFCHDRKKGRGGIAVYVNENIVAQQKKVTMCKSLETTLLELHGKRKRLWYYGYLDSSSF